MRTVALALTLLSGVALAQARDPGLTFVSLSHGVYTFEYDHTTIRAKCYGTYAGVNFVRSQCNLGDA
jgi:hypothetical protein